MRKDNKNLEPYRQFDGRSSLKYNGKHYTLTKVRTTEKLRALKSKLICALTFRQKDSVFQGGVI